MKRSVTAIDLFAGCGGFTTGATMAGVDVLWAANHSRLAVQFHEANHSGVKHVCQDLHQADWSTVPQADIVLASPCCQGHAKARGKDRPHHDASRSTAWAVVSCCEHHRPQSFIVENVPEFLEWSLYPAWKMAMERLGYILTTQLLDAAEAGVAQNRLRMFIVGNRRNAVTVAPATSVPRTAGEIVDFRTGKWSPIEKPGRAQATLKRIENGRRSFGNRFVMPYYKSGSGLTGRSLGRPLGTITTLDRWAVVDGNRMRMLTVEEYRRAMGFPDGYQLPKRKDKAIYLLGNAVPPPLAKHVVSSVIEQM